MNIRFHKVWADVNKNPNLYKITQYESKHPKNIKYQLNT